MSPSPVDPRDRVPKTMPATIYLLEALGIQPDPTPAPAPAKPSPAPAPVPHYSRRGPAHQIRYAHRTPSRYWSS